MGAISSLSRQSGADVQNRTNGRKSSVTSLFWLTPDRILFTEIVGGGGAILEIDAG